MGWTSGTSKITTDFSGSGTAHFGSGIEVSGDLGVSGSATVGSAGITATKGAGTLINNAAGSDVTPHANGGDAAPLTMNGVRSGTVTITLGGDFTQSGGEAIAVIVACDQITANDVIVATIGQSGASTAAANVQYLSTSAANRQNSASMAFWISSTYGTYDYDAGSGSEVILLNWVLL